MAALRGKLPLQMLKDQVLLLLLWPSCSCIRNWWLCFGCRSCRMPAVASSFGGEINCYILPSWNIFLRRHKLFNYEHSLRFSVDISPTQLQNLLSEILGDILCSYPCFSFYLNRSFCIRAT